MTGASAGIGAATALRLAKEGFDVVVGARRVERLAAIAAECGARALELDVTSTASVDAFAEAVGDVDVLVNNAGLAVGLSQVGHLSDDALATMWATNVAGVVRMTRTLLPRLEASGAGHIVNVGSTAGIETYEGGAGYTATKHALRAITRTLRLELLGKPVRVTDVSPGLVETEFSLVRFAGDVERAKKPYEGLQPLTPEDIADCIAWAVTRPPHVNVDEIIVRPLDQAGAGKIARRT